MTDLRHRNPHGLHALLLLAALAWLVAACTSMTTATVLAAEGATLSVSEVQPGVFVHTGALEDWVSANGGDVSNMVFVVGSRCVAVIDTGGTPALGQAWFNTVRKHTALPVCYVINTHAHPDHLLGNVAFSKGLSPKPQFVASARYSATLAAREPYYRNALQRDFGIGLTHADIIYPTIEVAHNLELDLGDRQLSLQAWPVAHTDNDLTALDQRTRTLVASDLLFVQQLPALDGKLRGWLCTMAELRGLSVATVVPGHGPVSNDWPAVMDAQANYLTGLLRDTRAALQSGLGLQQAVDRITVASDAHWALVEQFQRRNVTAAYAELEWDDDDPLSRAETSACAARLGRN
jgi:quinoprotein relay system zinc metallohydrolase 2